jgi:hypothetical protein
LASESAERARAWLLEQGSPGATDAALSRSLTSTLGVTVQVRYENRFPADGGFYQVPVCGEVTAKADADVRQAFDKISHAMTPATVEQCEYASTLREYPADVAKAACEALARGNGQVNWFPTLSEVIGKCEELVLVRRLWLDAARRWTQPQARVPHVETEAERAASNAKREADARAVHDMLAAYKRALPERRRPKVRANYGPVDETGITALMRETLARQGG